MVPTEQQTERKEELFTLKKISYEPGFDLDGALDTARRLAQRNDPSAHLAQVEETS